jgi:hypothetical protein
MSIGLATGAIIPRLFGEGLFGSLVTATLRIPPYMSALIAIQMVGELTMRGLGSTFGSIGFKPAEDSWVQKTAQAIIHYGVRPYKDVPTKDLPIRIVAFAALAVLGSELVRMLGGRAPGIYNIVLSLLGPLRIDTGSYLDGVRASGALLGIK